MAYDLAQKRVLAHELARSGGNVSAAVIRLRTEYETFRKVGDTTLRRLARKPEFMQLVSEHSAMIEKAHNEALEDRDRVREARAGGEPDAPVLAEIKALRKEVQELKRMLEGKA